MSLAHRLSRLMRADAHAVIDLMEDPASTLKQALRDMRQELERARAEMTTMRAQQESAQRAIGRLECRIQQCNSELDVCFENDEERLARVQLRRRLEAESALAQWEGRGRDITARIAQQEQWIREREERVQDIAQQAELVQPRSSDSDVPETPAVTDDDVELAFLKEKQRRSTES